MQELINQVIQWGEDRGIFAHSTPTKQIMKSASELGEIFDAFAKEDMEAAKLEIGDFMVTLILFAKLKGLSSQFNYYSDNLESNKLLSLSRLMADFSVLLHCQINEDATKNLTGYVENRIVIVCLVYGFDPKECLLLAYDKISKRKTTMVNGVAEISLEECFAHNNVSATLVVQPSGKVTEPLQSYKDIPTPALDRWK